METFVFKVLKKKDNFWSILKLSIRYERNKNIFKHTRCQKVSPTMHLFKELIKYTLQQHEGINWEDMKNKNRDLIQGIEPKGIPIMKGNRSRTAVQQAAGSQHRPKVRPWGRLPRRNWRNTWYVALHGKVSLTHCEK